MRKKTQLQQDKKQLLSFDDAEAELVLGFKWSERKEAEAYYKKITGEDMDNGDVQEVLVRAIEEEDGELYYDWSGKTHCMHCGGDFKDDEFVEGFVIHI